MEGCVEPRVFFAQDLGVVGVGGCALKAVHNQFLHTGDRIPQRRNSRVDGDLAALLDQ